MLSAMIRMERRRERNITAGFAGAVRWAEVLAVRDKASALHAVRAHAAARQGRIAAGLASWAALQEVRAVVLSYAKVGASAQIQGKEVWRSAVLTISRRGQEGEGLMRLGCRVGWSGG